MTNRPDGLLAWQWALYQGNHAARSNLLVHALTTPLFLVGTVAVPLAVFTSVWLAPLGVAGVVVAVALQGRTHRLESTPPAPFEGPFDVVKRIFAEQWVTFPRYVVSGGFARAWRASAK